MKRIMGGILLLFILILALYLYGCGHDAVSQKNASSDPVTISDSDTGEENNMNREFCTVESLHEGYFVLRNTKDELYNVDNAHLGSFKSGDQVLLIYSERTALEDSRYTAEVYAVYPNDMTLRYPAK